MKRTNPNFAEYKAVPFSIMLRDLLKPLGYELRHEQHLADWDDDYDYVSLKHPDMPGRIYIAIDYVELVSEEDE